MSIRSSFRSLSSDFSLSAVNAGFLTVLVGFTGSVIIVLDAARSLGATVSQSGSWILSLCIGMAAIGVFFSLRLKAPIAIAWSTSGAAVIAGSTASLTLPEAVGAFIFCGLLIAFVGVTGLFERFLSLIPRAIAASMLAGVLFNYGLGIFYASESSVTLVALVLGSFVLSLRYVPRYAVLSSVFCGVMYSYFAGQFSWGGVDFSLATLEFVAPEFSLTSVIGLGLPLFIVTMASQNLPGAVVLKTSDFNDIRVSPIIAGTGVATAVLAPFGGFTLNLATLTAAICIGPEAHPDRSKRYVAGIFAGAFYAVSGLLGLILVQCFAAMPNALIALLAGVALIGVLTKSLGDAMQDEETRVSALVTLLCTAANVSFLSVSSAFWGVLAGMTVHVILERRGKRNFQYKTGTLLNNSTRD